MEIIKSFRKTLSMNVDKTGKLIVKAPLFTSKKTIESFIAKNKNWIEERKKQVIQKIKSYSQWEKFYFFWEEYELLTSSKTPLLEWEWNKKLVFDWMNFIVNKNSKSIAKELFEEFYKREARKYIKNRLEEISAKYNLKYNKFSITSAKTRWGSCTSTKNINFTYRLIMTPIKTIDYVIVHELAHLKHMNHSKAFWTEVEKMMKWLFPWDYKIHKNWLKKYWDNLIF